MQAFIKQPERIPFFLKLGILISERITGKTMLPARILAWYPKAAIGSGVMEAWSHTKTGDDSRCSNSSA